MLIEPTLEKLNAMHITGMAHALEAQRRSHEHAKLSFDERVSLLVVQSGSSARSASSRRG